MESDRYSVYQFFADGRYEKVREGVSVQAAVRAAAFYCVGVNARWRQSPERVMITDGGDFCVFEWTREQGIIWPGKPA